MDFSDIVLKKVEKPTGTLFINCLPDCSFFSYVKGIDFHHLNFNFIHLEQDVWWISTNCNKTWYYKGSYQQNLVVQSFPLHTIEHIFYNHSSKHISNEDQQNPADYSNSFMVPYYPAANSLVKKLKKIFNIPTVCSKIETLGDVLKKKTHQPIEPMKRKGAIHAYPCEEKCSVFLHWANQKSTITRIKEEKIACNKAFKL